MAFYQRQDSEDPRHFYKGIRQLEDSKRVGHGMDYQWCHSPNCKHAHEGQPLLSGLEELHSLHLTVQTWLN